MIWKYSLLTIWALLSTQWVSAATTYQEHIAAILNENCTDCHNSGKQKGGLDLSSFSAILKGSSGGVVVKPGLPDSSPLYMAITHAEGVKPMPDEGEKLDKSDIQLVEKWIAEGLIDKPGGKSLLREMSQLDNSDGPSLKRPTNPAFPKNLPDVPFAEVIRPLPIVALALSPWCDLVAYNGFEQVILYGRTQPDSQFQHLGNLPFAEEEIHDLRFSADGEYLIAAGGSGGGTGYVVVFDVTTGKRISRLADEKDTVLSADISADKKYIAIGTPLKTVKIYSLKSGDLLHEIAKHTDWVTSVRFSPDGKLLATGDRNGSIYVWEADNGGIAFTLAEHNMTVANMDWRSDNKLLASGGDDGKLILWDMNDGWPTRSTKAHEGKSETRFTRKTGVLSTMIDRAGNIYSGGRDQKLCIWKPDGGLLKKITLDYFPIRIAGNHDGNYLAIGNERGELTIVDRKTGSLLQTISQAKAAE